MTVEEGLKMVVSGGLVTPPDRRPAGRRAPADGAGPGQETAGSEAGGAEPSKTLVSGG